MITTFFDNQEVDITAVYFRNNESYPKRMVYGGREYTFSGDSWRYQIKTPGELIRLFDVSDGQNQYRLRLSGSNHWTLVGIKATGQS